VVGEPNRVAAVAQHAGGRATRREALGDGGVDATMNEAHGLEELRPYREPTAHELWGDLEEIEPEETVEARARAQELVDRVH
jgi:hypothetical protein